MCPSSSSHHFGLSGLIIWLGSVSRNTRVFGRPTPGIRSAKLLILGIRCGSFSPESRVGIWTSELSRFLGLLLIVHQLVTPRYGKHAALWSILTLLSMPTLMLQATTTKNDLIIVFGVGWIYSLVRFQRNRNASLSLHRGPEPGLHRGLKI